MLDGQTKDKLRAEFLRRCIQYIREGMTTENALARAVDEFRSIACLPSSIVGLFHGALQPHLEQMLRREKKMRPTLVVNNEEKGNMLKRLDIVARLRFEGNIGAVEFRDMVIDIINRPWTHNDTNELMILFMDKP